MLLDEYVIVFKFIQLVLESNHDACRAKIRGWEMYCTVVMLREKNKGGEKIVMILAPRGAR